MIMNFFAFNFDFNLHSIKLSKSGATNYSLQRTMKVQFFHPI